MTTADGGRPDSYTFAVGTELARTTSGGDSCGEFFGFVERGVNERAGSTFLIEGLSVERRVVDRETAIEDDGGCTRN
jgi:hypothetical protein